MLRKTKIICTIGPKTLQGNTLAQLADKGMNIARLNFSHGNHESHAQSIKQLRQLKQAVAIMIDTQGPEIRTADRSSPLRLVQGQQLEVVTEAEKANDQALLILYNDLINSVEVGHILSLDNGLMRLKVVKKSSDKLLCQALDNGELAGRRHVNLPGIEVNLPAVTDKDKADILFAIEQEADFIALSFVRNRQALDQVRALLQQHGSSIALIAKIEEQQGIENLDEIIAAADGIMVARGDLGIEVGIERIPSYQRDIIKRCAAAAKPVIVATHLLESMIAKPIPTRAEVSDVATAVHQQADAIMLSGETSIGHYPVRCVEFFDSIASYSEQHTDELFAQLKVQQNPRELLAYSAVQLAERSRAKGVIVITKQGLMATYAAAAKPLHSHIFAFTFDVKVQRKLALLRAVSCFMLEFSHNAEQVVQQAISSLKEKQWLAAGDRVVILSDFLLAESFDSVQLRVID